MSALKTTIAEATKAAMKSRDKPRVGALRMINAEIQRVEVDERRELADSDVLAVLNRMLKQRQDALEQFRAANRTDLAAQEEFEIGVIRGFMPEPLSADDLAAAIDKAIAETGAASMKDMGKVMGKLKPVVQGRADMAAVSAAVKEKLAG